MKNNKNKRDISIQEEANRLSFGDRGLEIYDDTSTIDTKQVFGVIICLTDCEISINSLSAFGAKENITVSLPSGFPLYGSFTINSVSSGSIIGYIK